MKATISNIEQSGHSLIVTLSWDVGEPSTLNFDALATQTEIEDRVSREVRAREEAEGKAAIAADRAQALAASLVGQQIGE